MATASRVILVPPKAWSEEQLVDAARRLAAPRGPVRPGDAVGDLVVVRVEPEVGASADERTALDVLPTPRPRKGPLHLAVLLDASASMSARFDASRTRLEAASEALATFLFQGAGDVLTVLSYAKDPRVLTGPVARQPKLAFDAPKAGGKARTAFALDAALAHLAAQSHDGPQAIVLLTDGAGEPDEVRVSAQRAKRLGVAVHVVAFAPDVDPLLAEIASLTRGSVQRAPSPPIFDIPGREHHG